MNTLFDFISKLLAALSHAAGDSADKEEPAPAPDVPTVDTVTGWAGEPPYRYIDVSRYQGTIDWAQVAAAGYKGAMLKTVSTNKKLSKRADGLYIDPAFETNYRNARAAGLDVGVYYYTYATSEAMADAELSLVRQAVYGKELTMPIAVDVEENKLKPMSTPRPHQPYRLRAGTGGENGLLRPTLYLHRLQIRTGYGQTVLPVGRMAGGLHRQDPESYF